MPDTDPSMELVDAEIIIVGAGIGGLTLAIICKQLGISYKVLERTEVLEPAGAGISLSPNALRIFDQLGLYDDISRCSQKLRKIQIWRNSELWNSLDLADFQNAFNYPIFQAERHNFHRILYEAAGAERAVVLNSNVVDIVDVPGQPVCVVLDNGKKYKANIVVGADGIRSAVRRAMARSLGIEDAHNTIQFTGRVHFSGITSPLENLGPQEAGVANWMLYDKTILTTWPCPDNRQWYIGVKKAEDNAAEDRSVWGCTTTDDLKKLFGKAFHPFAEDGYFGSIADKSERAIASNVFQEFEFPTMFQGRVALLGDAAHSMTSFFGQGACQAIEDAAVLGSLLGENRNSLDNADQLLSAYATERAGRTKDMSRFSDVFAGVHMARLPYGLGPPLRRLLYTLTHVNPQTLLVLQVGRMKSIGAQGDDNSLYGQGSAKAEGETCRRQGADCIYDFEPPRPKARTINQDSSRSEAGMMRGDGTPGPHRSRSSTTGSPCASPGVIAEESSPVDDGENIARVLEQKFYENFSPEVGPRSNPWQERISTYNRALQSSLRERPESVTSKFSPKNVKYTGILSLLTHDLVGLVTDQFGSLGCHHVEEGGARFFLSALACDETQTMFDNVPHGGNPLSEYGQRQQTQLIDVWFSVHPLSFLVSKTLLLREIRDGTHDEILLAVMLADANFSIGDEVAVARGHVLLRWATAQLRTRPIRSSQYSQNGGVSTRIFSGISTAQALMLLAWNSLCSFQIRRATCYIGLAGRIATEIKEQISSTAAPMTSSRINGIDVFDVEKELVAYLYWTTYSLSLWAFIQMGNGHFSALLPTSLTSIFLPVTEASSVIIQLDMVSENFSTLQKQKAAIREMWPLAHIVSVIAYIYALYPQETDTTDSPTTNFWQEAPLLALQRLQQGKPTQDISMVCREINRVLMESIHILNRQVTEVSSRSLVLLVYHTMAIQFLFPILPQAQPEEGITSDLMDRFCASAQEILQIFATISEQPHDLFSHTPTLRASFPDVFCLALDTCARALSLLNNKKRLGGFLMDIGMINVYESTMETLAHRLYAMSQNDFLNQGTSLRLVRKHLKSCVRAFRSRPSSASVSSGMSSPDCGRSMASSMPHSPLHSPHLGAPSVDSDHMSTATTAVVEPSSYISPMDTTLPSSMSSSMPSSAGTSITSNPFSPTEELQKPDWRAADELFQNVMDPRTLEGAAGEHISVSDLVDMQNAWFPQMPGVMEFDMSGSMAGVQWDWTDMGPDVTAAAAAATAATTGSDVDSMLYYFENSANNKRT
ncbi:FAD-dependent monooxygenase pynG [Paramyrothecium foliicola]|nr:FAD-dependent monooxygenase pynG [Paramyrothecium foliicola]